MASGRIDESQFSSNEEQEVFAGFTIEEIDKIQQARQTQQEQNLLHNVDGKMEDSLDLPSQEKGSNSNVEVYAKESSNKARLTSTNRKDYSSDLEQMKLIPGKVWTQQIENLYATMWRHIHVISRLSTNTSPEPEIHAIQ